MINAYWLKCIRVTRKDITKLRNYNTFMFKQIKVVNDRLEDVVNDAKNYLLKMKAVSKAIAFAQIREKEIGTLKKKVQFYSKDKVVLQAKIETPHAQAE
jgi:hypothetical protein